MRPLAADARGRLANEGVVLAVQCHKKTGLGRRAERRHEVVRMQRRKLRDAAVAEEGLHADRAAFTELA